MKKISLLVLFISLLGCKQEYSYKNKIKEDVAFLADDTLEGRETGTKGEQAAAAYIVERFKELGLQPKGTEGFYQTFTFKPKKGPHGEVDYTNAGEDSTITGTNVLAYIDNQAENTIIIGAHYDHLGYGSEGSLHRGYKEIHNGADDNASGVAVMLDLAGKLKTANSSNNYLFMAFSGEEMGLLGSNYFTKNATLDLSKANYMINMDMVGRLKQDSTLAVYGVGTSPRWKQTLSATNPGFKIVENESGVGPSDHTSFYLQDIPVLHFFTGQHDDYHKPGDDTEKLNFEGMDAISNYIFDVITELDKSGKLAFRKTKNESEETPRFKVGLGVVPDYLFDGEGMRVDGISEDKPAQKAGLQKGDIVIKLGDSAIVDMMSYMRALSVFQAGDSTQVVVKRDGKTVEASIQF
ncbi:MAG: peptidase M28 [Xanthomarina sp.]|uniref:M28 family peptidase n=1 Tax=Xanthomarina sp. TaxID=1931211 RepID=UPI000C523A7D|nr:M28 family peptidase [Xanthomarina sp.]MAL22443.1 peptidase M28 [Xanthomarina sp.]MBF60886.1 peptidase M28 [Xanthomarina sp.]HAB27043.1 peptidase M28 [Xanthomarina gelatinilytica]HAI17223.1 peptidase M28 [Xanthomarina gelatinilytica]|tara:strand:+ start:2786 stop:4009 length:1224 start_codon:yes stop_codon:yes gene_type:complete